MNSPPDWQALYELSLSIGRSLDAQECCADFLGALLRRHEGSCASVWLGDRDGADLSFWRLHYSLPRAAACPAQLPLTHPALALPDAAACEAAAGPDHGDVIEANFPVQAWAVFRLADFGRLRIARAQGRFDAEELRLLRPLVEKFAVALQGALAHHGLKSQQVLATALYAAIPDPLWVKDTEGRYIACNAGFETLMGRRAQEVLGKTDFDLAPAASARQTRRADRALLAAGSASVVEEWLGAAGGERRRLLETVKAPMHDASGRVLGLLNVARDITDRRTAELARRVAETRYHVLFEALAAGVLLVDRHGTIRASNRAAQRILRRHENLLLGQPLAALGWRFAAGRSVTPDSTVPLEIDRLRDGAFSDEVLAMCHADASMTWLSVSAEMLEIAGDGSANEIVLSFFDITARTEAESALAQSRAQVELALDAAGAGLWDWNIGNGAVEFDARWAEILGFEPGELPPTIDLWQRHAHPDDVEPAQAMLIAHLRGEIALFELEVRMRHRDGHYIWVQDRGRVVARDAAGRALRMAGTRLDITRRKADEIALQTEHALFARGPVAVLVWPVDMDKPLVYASHNVASIFGYSAADMLAPDFRYGSLVDPADLLRITAEVRQFLAAGRRDWVHRYRIRHADGSTRWLYDQTTVQPGPDGVVRHLRGYVMDDTEQRAQELQLRKLSMAVEQCPVAVLIADQAGCVEYANASFSRMSGYDADEVRGRAATLFTGTGDDPAAAGNTLWAELRAGHSRASEGINRRKDGSTYAQALLMAPMRSSDGRITHFVCIMEDISERKRIEAELICHRDHLEELVTERTAKLAAATSEAEAANRAKSTFLANMSHEMRTPLNAILGFTHLLQQTAQEPPQQEQLRQVGLSATHLLDLINAILDLSRIEAGKFDVDTSEFDVDGLQDSLAALVGDQAAARGLDLIFDVAPDVPASLRGDVLRLKQILANLLSNAVKFTQHGHVVLRLQTKVAPGGGMRAVFEVEDSGPGIAPEVLQRLFRPFEQGDASTTRQFGGSGLGLAISRGLAELLEGRLTARSQVGAGSTFRLDVPLAPAAAPPAVLPLAGRDVLLLRAADAARAALACALRNLGAKVQCADSIAAAGAVLAAARRDSGAARLVLLDPGVGPDASAAPLRALQAASAAPLQVIALCRGNAPAREQLLTAGFDGWLVQPLRRGTCAQMTERLALGRPMPVPALDGAALARQGFGPARILLVEDHPVNQQVALQLLAAVGLGADLAADGRRAVELARNGNYSLVLMDVQMPVMDGLAATREIRRQPQCADLPIIAMTADAFKEDRERCLAAGMNGHIAKPIDPERLYAALEKWLCGERPQIRPLPPAAPPGPGGAQLPRGIDGLDVEAGLKTVLGRVANYTRLLRKFAAGRYGNTDELEHLLAAGDFDAAQRLAHTLKGVAGGLGAHSLQKLAGDLNLCLRDQPQSPDVTQLAARLCGERARLAGAIRSALPDPPPLDRSTLDWDQALAAARRLLALVERRAIAAIQHFDEHAPLLRAAFGDELWQALDAALDAMRYDAALGLLRDAAMRDARFAELFAAAAEPPPQPS
ncbi:MAG: PAS domain S-box protein [Rhodocyclaceae bacterium]|nr:PAS domain S-box protein [Rhodocyclaceae bacterium]